MEKMICVLFFIAVLACLVYRLHRFLAKDEITTCFGEHYQWKGQEGKEK